MLTANPDQFSMFAFQKKYKMVYYILSTISFDDDVDGETEKPDIIMDYNNTKTGVHIIHQIFKAHNSACVEI